MRLVIVAVVLSLLGAPLAVGRSRRKRSGVLVSLWPGAAPPAPPRMESLRQGLREAGYVEGQNLAIELRYSDKGAERLRELAAELVRLDVQVIVVYCVRFVKVVDHRVDKVWKPKTVIFARMR